MHHGVQLMLLLIIITYNKEGSHGNPRTIYVRNRHQIPIENPDMTRVRLIADEGKALTIDSENFYLCIDVDSAEGWIEVDSPPELSEMKEALRILGVTL